MPKIFIVIIVLLVLAGVGLWYFGPGQGENNKATPNAAHPNTAQPAAGGTNQTPRVQKISNMQVKGKKARAIMLINPQAFPEIADVNEIAKSEAKNLNQPAILQKLLQSTACDNLPADLLAELRQKPSQYIQANAAANSSFIELDVQSGSYDSAGQLAQALATAYIEYAKANNLPQDTLSQADAILLIRVVPLD